MGAEASKPTSGPQDLGQSGNQFQVISPMSDLSNPSDIHRLTKNRNLHKKNLSAAAADPARRNAAGINPPPPSHFYFPTKDTERAVERAERRNQETEKENEKPKLLKKTKKIFKKTQKVMAGCFMDAQAPQLERAPVAKKTQDPKHYDGTLGIARKVMPKKSKTFDELFGDEKPEAAARENRAGVARPAIASGRSFVIREAEGMVEPMQYSQVIAEAGKSATLDFGAGPALHQADDYFSRLTAERPEESPYMENKTYNKQYASALGPEEPESPVSNLFEDNESSDRSKNSPESSLAESDIKKERHEGSELSEDLKSPGDSMLQYQKAIGTIAETPGVYPDDAEIVSKTGNQLVLKPSSEVMPYGNREVVQKGTATLTPVEEPEDDDSDDSTYYRPTKNNTKSAFRTTSAVQKQSKIVRANSKDEGDRRLSKLETLFRPVLPALSADDAQSVNSYDPWEIKVTESAPSVIESKEYKEGALQQDEESPRHGVKGSFSPSMLSIDSQVDASPAMTKTMVSDQASYNAKFLFSAKGKTMLSQHKKKTGGERESEANTINTRGSRSRVLARSGAEAVKIPKTRTSLGSKQSQFTPMDAVSGSVGLAPKESIDVPELETKLSDLTDASSRRYSKGTNKSRNSILKSGANEKSEKKRVSFGTMQSGSVGSISDQAVPRTGRYAKATPHSKVSQKKGASNPPYTRFQSAKTMFEQQTTVEVPTIQNKVSDLTERSASTYGRLSSESEGLASEIQSVESQSIKSQSGHNWTYNDKDASVTPAFGKLAKQTTKSPYLRFENAKNKFGQTSSSEAKKAKQPSPQKKLPYKSPRSSRVKQGFRKPRNVDKAGSVASKIQELNQRVVEAKIDRKKHRWTKSNPRKYGVIDSNAVRTRAIVSYKTDTVGLDRINYMSAAKFNSIPVDDDSVASMPYHEDQYENEAQIVPFVSEEALLENEDDDEDSKLTHDDVSKLTTETATVATVRQEERIVPRYTGARASVGSFSTMSSGFSKVKKQVFRGSISESSQPSRQSMYSNADSTTMSSILGKENDNLHFRAGANTVKPTELTLVSKPDLHLSPTQRTPMQAQKWRTLAAAAHQKDSQRKMTRGIRGLAVRQGN